MRGMKSRPPTMTNASMAGATPLLLGLPEEIIVWEILVRLPPKPLLRCRAVCRAWCCTTSTRSFLQAHHRRQPCLPIVRGSEYGGARHQKILAFDHRAVGAQLQHVARLKENFSLGASCDGLLILSEPGRGGPSFSVCNPVTLQHAPLPQLSGFGLMGMYRHYSTGEYRLLLCRMLPNQIGCYVFALGSDQPPRYIEALEVITSGHLSKPVLVRDNLHWYVVPSRSDPQQYHTGSQVLVVFDTTSESFRQMRAPVLPASSYIFEMDGILGIYRFNYVNDIVDIWMLQNYESEIWTHKYRVELPVVKIKIKERLGLFYDNLYVSVHSVDGDVLLLVNHGGWMFHVDTDGKLVDSFRLDDQLVFACQLRLKQTLVPHTFFTALEGYDMNASPFV